MSGLSEQIATSISEAILAHRVLPGAKLGERELAEIFKVSRIVIRQALIRLADDGLVTVERNRGAFVARPSLSEALAVFETLTIVEHGVLAQLANRTRPAPLADLEANVAGQQASLARGDDVTAGELGLEFHTILVGLTGNPVTMDLHAQLRRRARLLETLYPVDFAHCQLCEEHARLLAMMERGRWAGCLKLIDEHYRLVARGYRVENITPAEEPLSTAFRLGKVAMGGTA